SMDFVEPLISFIVSRFTTDHSLLFGAYAALFGYFYLKSVTFSYNLYRQNPGWNNLIHLIFFIAILPVTAINGVRMWTAAWIFLYGAFHVILYRNPLYFIITAASVFMHWSFITVNAILVIYYFAGNRNLIYLPIAAVSFVLPRFLSTFFQKMSLLVGGGLQDRYAMYSGESYRLVRQEQFQESAWFLKIGYDLVFYYLIIASIILHYSFSSRINSKNEKNLFSFLLLFLAFVNFGKEIPSFGGRFQMIFLLFGTLYLILIYSRLPGRNISFLTFAGLFPMLLLSAINFRQGADSINVWLFTPVLGSPLYLPVLSVGELLFH
ncbi:MAG: hypothetical protein GX876_05565, partial [Bacteroidales bacterium]|nr:hypothetical protein [Bacteroidales bacterium]